MDGWNKFYKPNNLNLAKKFVKQMSFNRLERNSILPTSLKKYSYFERT